MDQSQQLYAKADLSSFANPLEAISTNITIKWDIDFDLQTISGSVEHTIKIVKDGADHVDFDSSKIKISGNVYVNNEAGTYTASPVHEILGTKLSVAVPPALRTAGTTFSILFNYSIGTDASAMQWLDASATKGQKYPYLFTQSQAIHARSLMPCQDSPGIKTQYSARVSAPKWCTVLMSAVADEHANATNPIVSKNVFYWNQPVPTPAYLIALAAGHLESREISNRVRVWAEPEVVEAALFEFSETEEFVQAAESLTGCAYQWGRYDILCLPPSFPYGGMENPCLTFATPTLLAGDKSLADVIAHEIAHSWTGNLVTNHNWDHFWLNEGWTVWLERKITSKVRNDDEIGKLSSQIGWKHLVDDVKLLGEGNQYTALVWNMPAGEDPDNAYSSVPYEKGCNLLQYLEEVVGTELFSGFVKSYIDTFKFGTVTTGEFRDHFVSYFDNLAAADTAAASSNGADVSASGGKKGKNNKKKNDTKQKSPTQEAVSTPAVLAAQAIKGLDWNNLFFSLGLPADVTSFSNSLSKAAEDLARKWIALAATYKTDAPPTGCTSDDIKTWSTQQKNVFLETLQGYTKKSLSHPADVFTVAFLELMDRTYQFGASRNAEIMLRWQTLCLESEAPWILPQVVDFITSQGRMKFARPLYRLLRASSIGKQLAIDTYEANRDRYHPIARKMIGVDLKKAAAAEQEAIEEQLQAEHELSGAKAALEPVSTNGEEHAERNGHAEAPKELEVQSTPVSTPAKAADTPVQAASSPKFYTPETSEQSTPVNAAHQKAATPQQETSTPAKASAPTPAAPAPTPASATKESPAPAATPAPAAPARATPVIAAAAPAAAPAKASPAVTAAAPLTLQAPQATETATKPVPAPISPAPAKASSPAATSQTVSTFSWTSVTFLFAALGTIGAFSYFLHRKYRK